MKSIMQYAANWYIQRHIATVFKDAFAPVPPLLTTIVVPHQPLMSQVSIVAKVRNIRCLCSVDQRCLVCVAPSTRARLSD